MKDLILVKELHLETVPTKAQLQTTFNEHKFEGPKDFIVTSLAHRAAKMFLKSGAIDSPGTYLISVRIKLPIMFWHKVRYNIRKL